MYFGDFSKITCKKQAICGVMGEKQIFPFSDKNKC
jgi:hypothetical protein